VDGELITDRGVGNGMSVLIFTTVISVIPGEILAIYRDKGAFYAAVSIVVVIAIVAFIVFMEAGAAPHPCAIRQADGRPPDVRRHVDP